MKNDSKIFVAGHRGLVGSAIIRKLKAEKFYNIITKTKAELDLRNQIEVENFFRKEKPEYVFLAAAKVGGIYANDTYSAEFIYDNMMIQNNVIHNAWKYEVEKLLFMGSVCIYPKYAETPVKEESLLTGFLEPTNDAYAIAKISGIKMCQAYHKQYGFKSVSIMPSNLYGPNDNFHPQNGHVIPAMIRKFSDNSNEVTFWGDGSAYREFLYADDMADACFFLMNNSSTESGELVNVGSGEDISIKELAFLVSDIMGYKGKILWDLTKPNGTPKRPLDFSKITNLGWKPKNGLREGLTKTLQWYKENGYNWKSN